MPMFRSFVPEVVRPWLYVLLAFCFQFSGGVYLGAMPDVVGEHALMREDVQMSLYNSLKGRVCQVPDRYTWECCIAEMADTTRYSVRR